MQPLQPNESLQSSKGKKSQVVAEDEQARVVVDIGTMQCQWSL